MEWVGLHILQRWMWLVPCQYLPFILSNNGAGFATFFTIFELSRCAGLKAKEISADKFPLQLLPAINGIVLVTGGVGGLRYSHCASPLI